MIRLLLERGAQVDLVDPAGETPLDLARDSSSAWRQQVLERLL